MSERRAVYDAATDILEQRDRIMRGESVGYMLPVISDPATRERMNREATDALFHEKRRELIGSH